MECGFLVTAVTAHADRWRDELPRLFHDLEQAGCDSLWVADHLFAGYPAVEPFVLATLAVQATQRCAVGTGVVQLPLRVPSAVAKSASTLQLLSNGRFRLGIGVGQHESEFDRAGIDFHTRGAATDRAIGAMKRAWAQSDDWYAMRPSRDVPIWVGGSSDAALRRAAEWADGYLGLFVTPERYAKQMTQLDDYVAEHGRPASALRRHLVLFLSPTDAQWTRTHALHWIEPLFPTGTKGVERHIVTGTPNECAEHIRRFEDNGAQGIDLMIAHPNASDAFQCLRAAIVEN